MRSTAVQLEKFLLHLFYGLMDSNEGNIISFFGGIDIAIE
jgi:hypothetical protein